MPEERKEVPMEHTPLQKILAELAELEREIQAGIAELQELLVR
jgi:hypothetical protein